MMTAERWTARELADALVSLLEEPFATPEDVGLDVRRIEPVEASAGGVRARGRGRVAAVEIDLADGSCYRIAVERLA